ncbi:MAG TPA: hypothetical protein VFI28_06860 [Candidatus Limnocylindrales bacterium]|nr:hypothetical protein [Candidatus Limnocylindrales bacterium]
MFATLVGALPEPPAGGDLVRSWLAAQLDAGLELLSFEAARNPDVGLVERWRRASVIAGELGAGAVKAAVLGPYSSASGQPIDETVEVTRAVLEALVDAGCSFVEVHEPAAAGIGEDAGRRGDFRRAHERLVEGMPGHLCLAITGGNADAAGVETIVVPGYRSYLFDLIAGPDNWRLVTRVPPGAGVVVGALDPRPGARNTADVLVWAAHYAASTGGRGLDRVGLATAGSLGGLGWDEAVERLRLLGEAARIAGLHGEDLGRSLDPRNVDARSAAMGRYAPARMRRGGRRPA